MKKFILTKFIFIAMIINMNAQKWTTYNTTNTSTTLCGKSVYSIAIDKKGNKWFATRVGVSEFDGANWNSFSTITGQALAADKYGNIWIGTYGDGVMKYDGCNWTNFKYDFSFVIYQIYGFFPSNPFPVKNIATDNLGNVWFEYYGYLLPTVDANYIGIKGPFDELKNQSIQDFKIDKLNTKWFATGSNGILEYNDSIWINYTADNGLTSNFTTSVAIDLDGKKWFGTSDNGISSFDDVSWKSYTVKDGLPSNFITAIAIDNKNNKWIATDKGLVKFDGVNWKTFETIYRLGRTMFIDSLNNIWIGTDNGVLVFDGEKWTNYTRTGLYSDNINSIAVDKDNNKWFDTDEGVTLFNDTTWITLDSLKTLTKDTEGNIWASSGYELNKYDGKSWIKYPQTDSLFTNKIYFDNKNNIWGASIMGLSMFDGTNIKTYTTNDGLASNEIRSITVDKKNNIWAICSPYTSEGFTVGGGLSLFNGTNWKSWNTSNGLQSNLLRAIAIDSLGVVWVASDSALASYNGNKWVTYKLPENLAGDEITSIFIDYKQIWLSRLFGFISIFDGSRWTYYNLGHSAGNRLTPIITENNGYYWVGDHGGGMSGTSGSGVWKFDGTSWTNYTQWDNGFNSTNCLVNNNVTTVAIDKKGNKWFGTSKGISKFENENVVFKVFPDKLFIPADGGKVATFNIESNIHWSITKSDFLTVSSDSGLTNSSINVWTAANADTFSHFYSLNVKGDGSISVQVEQLGQPYLSLSESSLFLNPSTFSDTFLVYSNIEWNLKCNSDWVTISKSQGIENDTIKLSVTYNIDSTERTAIITAEGIGVNPVSIRLVQAAYSTDVSTTLNNEFTISPNPVSKNVLISLSKLATMATIGIYDLNGEQLLLLKSNEQNILINMENFAPGIYVIKVTTNNNVKSSKIVKQ